MANGMLDPEMVRRLGKAIAATAELAVAVLAGVIAGSWLDKRLDTDPFFLLILSLAGLVVGFLRLSRWLKNSENSE